MKKAPLGEVVLAFITGILVAEYTNIPFIIFCVNSLLALILGIIFLKSKTKFIIFFLAAVLFLGGAAFRDSQFLPHSHISNFTQYKGNVVYVEGVVDNDPVIKSRYTSFILKALRLIKDNEKQKVCGKILVKVSGKRALYYGNRLLIEGKLYRAPYYRISKRLNYREHLKRRALYSMLSVGKDSTIRLLDRGQGSPLKTAAFYIRNRIKKRVKNNMAPFPAGVLNAVILGERENLANDLREIMVQTGTVHIIAISGLHVGLVSFIALMFLRIFRVPKKVCYVITAVILILYCILTGARTPVVRVTITAVILFFGYIMNRQVSIYNALSLAALVILFLNPQQLFDVSFQLSFISIISIIGFSPKIKALLSTQCAVPSSRGRYLAALFCGSLAAWIGLLPLIAYYFNIITPIAILANMIVVPYLSIVVGSSFLFLLTLFVCPSAAYIFSSTSEAVMILLFKLISLLAKIPGAYFYLPDIPVLAIIFYYIFVTSFIFLAGVYFHPKEERGAEIN